MSRLPPTLLVCSHQRLGAGSCTAAGSTALRTALKTHLAARGLDWQVAPIGCLGHCDRGANLKAAPGGPLLHGCRAEDAEALIDGLLASWPAKS